MWYSRQAGGGEEDDLVSLTRKLKDYQGYQPISDVAAVAAENTELKDALEKECWKRKVYTHVLLIVVIFVIVLVAIEPRLKDCLLRLQHCEKQIQQLQNKVLH